MQKFDKGLTNMHTNAKVNTRTQKHVTIPGANFKSTGKFGKVIGKLFEYTRKTIEKYQESTIQVLEK